jgi:hypothetical protein
MSDTQLILEKLNKIELDIKKVNERLDTIEKNMLEIKISTNKMDNHINFVDSTYEIFKAPMSDLLAYYYGTSETLLIENKNNK